MGLFCVNLHFRTGDEAALSEALDRRGVTQYRLYAPKNGWTSLVEAHASMQDDAWLQELVGGLCADLHVVAIAFLVHDSDFACYWLFEAGRLLDAYNSWPDYFDPNPVDDGPARPTGGLPELLLPHCRSGVELDEVAALLKGDPLFAEELVEQLAGALGIDAERALADYRDGDDETDVPGVDGTALDDSGLDRGRGQAPLSLPAGIADPFARLFGTDAQAGPADPAAEALVQAAATGDSGAVVRLLAAGIAVDVEALGPLPGGQPLAGLGQIFPGGVPQIAMTPLLAAIANGQHGTADRLLAHGADPNRHHALFGTPVHAAAGAGDVALLTRLLDRGGNADARNAQGQTPLQLIAASRAGLERLAQVQAQMASLGLALPDLAAQVTNLTLPIEGWNACERLLQAHRKK